MDKLEYELFKGEILSIPLVSGRQLMNSANICWGLTIYLALEEEKQRAYPKDIIKSQGTCVHIFGISF